MNLSEESYGSPGWAGSLQVFLVEEGSYEGLRILTDLGNTGSLLQKDWKAVLALIYLPLLPRAGLEAQRWGMRVPKTAFPEGWLTLGLGIPGGLHILTLISKARRQGHLFPVPNWTLHSFHLRRRGPIPEPVPSTNSESISPSSLFHIPCLRLDLIFEVPLLSPSLATGC